MHTTAIAALVLVAILAAAVPAGAHAHSLFNSSEKFVAGHRVQVSTLPEFPQIGEPSQILFRITDADFEELPGVIMGVRLLYNDAEVYTDGPRVVEGAHEIIEFVFEDSGNHIMHVDLYGLEGVDAEIVTYTFNIGTQSPFGYIFFLSITAGAAMFSLIVGYIYLPGIIRRRRLGADYAEPEHKENREQDRD